ncbi:MAG TPA: hypothetical protein VIT64_15820 [Ilumatobacteraceae bacterium]
MIRLDAATVLLQWATGGMLFCWFTTRRREVGLGYGWLLRGTYFVFAVTAAVIGFAFDTNPVREAASIGVALACLVGLSVSIARRRAGVSGQTAEHDRRSERVAMMTGIERQGRAGDADADGVAARATAGPEFPPVLDLVPALIGAVGLVAAGIGAGGNDALAVLRTLTGAAFLGAVTDAMLLGHWYLVQPGLPRRHLNELVGALGWVWPVEVAVLLIPTGMLSVLSGSVDDGWNGTLGWFWVACAVTTIVLVFVTRAALKERYYSAVMAATGLLYLAILTAFGTDLVARAVLAG